MVLYYLEILAQTEELLDGCRPYKISEGEMKRKLLSKRGIRLDRTLKLLYPHSFSEALRILQRIFRSQVVNGSEQTRTAFLSSKFHTNVKLYLMFNLQEDKLNLEIRCVGRDAVSTETALSASVRAIMSVLQFEGS